VLLFYEQCVNADRKMAGRMVSKLFVITKASKLNAILVRLQSSNSCGPSPVAPTKAGCSSAKSNKVGTSVGFIGIGKMGAPMARHLAKKGHKLNVFDILPKACADVQSDSISVCKDHNEVVENSDIIITMLPCNDIVLKTYETIAGGPVKGNQTFIDCSTIRPIVAQKVQQLLSSKGARFVDAPVSGGVIDAEKATLAFLVGGTVEDYEQVKSILACMSTRTMHCGGYGMGQAANLCNNMMMGISMIGVCETMSLAVRMGLDAKVFGDILNSSTGRCWASEVHNPVPGVCPDAPCNKDYAGGFSTDMIARDMGLAANIAAASNTPISLGAAAHQIYRMLQLKGFGNKDFFYVYEYLKEAKQKDTDHMESVDVNNEPDTVEKKQFDKCANIKLQIC